MIVGFLLNTAFAILNFIVNLLPTVAFPSQIGSAFSLVWGYVNLFSMIIPVGTIVTLLGLIVVYESIQLIWRFMHWLLQRIPFLN